MKIHGIYAGRELAPNTSIIKKQTASINAAIRDIRIGAFLTFFGINIRFITGNLINALIFFNILQPRGPDYRYDMHTPSTPDMCGDVVMIVAFAIAYIFYTSPRIMNIFTNMPANIQNSGITHHLRSYIHQSKKFFSVTMIGFGLYFFLRYFFSPGLEVVFIENTTPVSIVLNMLSDMIRLCSPLIFVYAYCCYLNASRHMQLALFLFFVVRNLFATNLLGCITEYDIHVGAPFLEILSPLIIIYSVHGVLAGRELKLSFYSSLVRDMSSVGAGENILPLGTDVIRVNKEDDVHVVLADLQKEDCLVTIK
ncbi:MAG: hypothetical protein E3K32_14040 [wastewater metagenome]|nr:hypothetical protein [Candidatus Loosdrechtia aerotolerans]